ncbi:putative uncharacterized protein DDB_G0292292 [Teleopsis dalmanni]|uniref:putative uncharacterized protein DDB_G0292292 n=2 Tax=Teleopsis dalmanni TaxID=139649 RepID=UPI0018CCBB98|nr:putative uncharacterized protein DDB_G0292292 [Teleopsis dalmanni]
MADTINKPKLQLRTGVSVNGDKTPSPATKLLINHGKPNFTISRSNKLQQNGDSNDSNNNNNNENGYTNGNNISNDFIVKSTKFNGVFKPANVTVEKQVSTENEGIKVVLRPTKVTESVAVNNGTQENEAAKVVLRRAKVSEPALKDGEDDSVPEFIRRQRRIQERLTKENILDFENRRSGYFTHVMISPTATTANRTSFVETMSSPAIVPALEIPPPIPKARIDPSTLLEEEEEKVVDQRAETIVPVATNGYINDEEEVAKAIEEVNKAVAGEDDDKIIELEQETGEVKEESHERVLEIQAEEKPTAQPVVDAVVVAVTTAAVIDEPTKIVENEETGKPAVIETAVCIDESKKEETTYENATTEAEAIRATVAAVATSLPIEEVAVQVEETHQNGHVEEVKHSVQVDEHKQNGEPEVTILHTNGVDGPSIPTPDPSGALGVNFEPKTVVSFSKDLSSEPNKYPDTVKVVKDGEVVTKETNEDLKDLAKLKFDIQADEKDVQVTPVLRTEEN